MLGSKKKVNMHKNLMGVKSVTQIPKNNKKNKSKSNQTKLNNQGSRSKSKNLKESHTNRFKGSLKSPTPKTSTKRQTSKTKSNKSIKKKGSLSPNKPNNCKNIYTDNTKTENFMINLTDNSFKNLQTLKLNLLSYIFKKRIIKDEDYNRLYEELMERFPQQEGNIRKILFEIVSLLDS